ncbi:MAG: ABC transporter ATP-binding protein [Anaerolineae bacterium]
MPTESAVIRVTNLCKHFKVPSREAGLRAATHSLFRRTFKTVKAVDNVTFEIGPGEMVGFLGPNGAGKTTTLKMLSGLLYPTAGTPRVLGFEPSRRQSALLRQITLVMGNRYQLEWDLPAVDSFELRRAIYSIPRPEFERTIAEFVELLDLKALLKTPIRNLSLGERMKMEIVGALLHRPKVLFLDEPTIGLDVTMQRRIRGFIHDYNVRYRATVLLTSHYMADVEALCKRVIVIHNGRVLFDGDLSALLGRFSAFKTIGISTGSQAVAWGQYGEVVEQELGHVRLRIAREQAPQVTARILAEHPVDDLTVEDPPIEDVIERVFDQKLLETGRPETIP